MSTVTFQTNLPYTIHKLSLSVALEDLRTLSINLDISTLISDRVFVIEAASLLCNSELNSTLNLKNPSFGFPG
jgi:hypothetical protein